MNFIPRRAFMKIGKTFIFSAVLTLGFSFSDANFANAQSTFVVNCNSCSPSSIPEAQEAVDTLLLQPG